MTAITPNAETKPFWDGVSAGELRLQRCSDCGRALFYPRVVCPYCFSDQLSWFTASGTGTVYSCTVAHRAFGEFAGQAPYTIALIDLVEGPRMLSRITSSGQCRIGDQVKLDITRLDPPDSPELAYFRVVATS
jgi:uncharacterized OB-fold protein